MRQIIANFKMNYTVEETKQYMIEFLSKVDKEKAEITLCLPYTSLAVGNYFLKDSSIKLGAQNLSDEEEGKFTGEINGKMLVSTGVQSVIVGHSERRTKFKENSKIINKKIKIALKNRLNVILCVGESLTEKNTLKTLETIKNQLEEALKGLYENELERVTIAYEPIWAIGSGKSATIKEIEYAVKAIRKVLSDDFSPKAGKETQVLYGGSITNKNVQSIMRAKEINGILVGGACLDANGFASLINIA